MVSQKPQREQRRAITLENLETDYAYPLDGQLRPQIPPGAQTSTSMRQRTPGGTKAWSDLRSLRWVMVPASSLKMLLSVVLLWANWEILAPYVANGLQNPFQPLLFISNRVQTSSDIDPRYQKGYLDLVFVAYYIIFWSFVRQSITIYLCRPLARWFGIKREAKLDRFGEQAYALLYFAFNGAWGVRVMSQLPTWWYRTEYYFIGYPHWDMKPEMKRYYLMQAAYWCQQLLVLLLKLEKPRKDYVELVAHHFVTVWLIGWSYLTSMTPMGNAIFVSMDLPDAFFAFSKLLNYIQWNRAKIVSFAVFFVVWTYFRHYLNLVVMYSVWTEFDLVPEWTRRWSPKDGVWMVWWLKYQMFGPLLLLQCLNLFWYTLILRVAYRALTDFEASDDRSDDEDDDEEPIGKDKED